MKDVQYWIDCIHRAEAHGAGKLEYLQIYAEACEYLDSADLETVRIEINERL